MRITRLDLLRFGKFTDKSISLPCAQCDFHLIVGPNEAGKSTIRNAIQDLLFGIETRSRYNFLHAHNEMRLGALVEHAGSPLDFIRTKARTKTLQTVGGSALPDNALTSFLGQIDRTFFDQMFGLNHERLVQGGQEILSASNDVGQILFQAAAGVGSLGTIRDKLEAEADGLWAARKSDKREYYLAVAELEQAETALKNATVRTKDWQEARNAVDAIEDRLKEARSRYDVLAQDRFRLERVRRIAPMLATLEEVEHALAGLGDVVDLPANSAEQLARAEHDLAIAAQSGVLYAKQIADLNQKISELHPDNVILARVADIESLSAMRQQLRNHESDMAKREGEIRVLWQDVQESARQLAWPQENEDATERRLPVALVRSALGGLVRRHGALTQALAAAQDALKTREDEINAIDAEISLEPETLISNDLAESLNFARSLGDTAATEKRFLIQIKKLQRELDGAKNDLGNWSMATDQLCKVLPPCQDECTALLKRRADFEKVVVTSQGRKSDINAEIRALQLEITQYKAAHHPVTLKNVLDARSERDVTWHSIKAGTVKPLDVVTHYEQAVSNADGAADKRHDKAREETELQANLDRLQRLELQLAEHSERAQGGEAQLQSFDQDWLDRMDSLGISGIPLIQMNDWRAARERTLSAAANLDDELSQQASFVANIADAKSALIASLRTDKPDEDNLTLAGLIRLADESVGGAARLQERRSALSTQKIRAQAAVPELRNRVSQTASAVETWQADMQKGLAQASLPVDASIDTVEAAMALFERMHQQLQKIRETRLTRVDMMQRDLDAFATAAKALAADVVPEMTGSAPVQISLQLESVLKQHAASFGELGRLKGELVAVEKRAAAVHATMNDANASLEPLLRLSGAASNDELRLAVGNSDRLRALTSDKQQSLKQLLNSGDGLDRDALTAELATSEADAVSADLADNKRQTNEVVEQQNRLSGELTSANSILGKIAGQDEAARAEAKRQEALAKMANVLERFIKVFTAAKLLRWSIEKFRESKQGPMLSRASDVFSGLTQGAFNKLIVDYESEPLKLSGQRAAGGLVDIDGMSEGTRDQLYLALRLSALELHLEQTVALPFIADDLFINYDDGRAKAGLQALAKLSEKTQVIFLTHHDHLIPVAESVFGEKLNVVYLV